MKWKLDRKYTTIAVYALLVIAFALVLCTIFLNIRAIGGFFATIWEKSLSVLFGVFFTFCLLPAVKFFEKLFAKVFNRTKEHPTLVSLFAAFTVDLFFVGILVVAVVGIIPSLLDAVDAFRDAVAPQILAFGDRLESTGSPFASIYRRIYDMVASVFSPDTGSFISSIATFAKNFFSRAYAIGVGLVLATYFLVCRRYLTAISRKLSVALLPDKFRVATFAVVKRIYYFFVEFFSYRLISGFAMSLIVFLLFLPFRIDYGIIVATVLFVGNFIPVFGPVVATLGCTVLIAVFSPVWKAVVAFTILSAIEILVSLFIEPFCLRKKLRPGPGIVVTSVIVCYALFGFGGVIFAVPLYSSLDVAYREIQTRLLVRKGLPTSNSYYLALEELPETKPEKVADTPVSEETSSARSESGDDKAGDTAPSGTASVEPVADATSDAPSADPAAEDTSLTDDADSVYVTDHYILTEQGDMLDRADASDRMPIPDDLQPDPSVSGGSITATDFPTPTELPKPDTVTPPKKEKTGFWASLRGKRK